MSVEEYKKAQKAGQRSYHAKVIAGEYPYLPALMDMLPAGEVLKEVKLGLEHIPMELIAGTYTRARQNAFAPNFMPLLDIDTEFGLKWSNLCDAHLNEGIHDAISAYEYMNHYYVQEGNKRVSVMKHFGAVSIPGTVIRIMPKKTEDKENKIYYEYVDFYELSRINYMFFSQLGSYDKLQKLLFDDYKHVWNDIEKETLYSLYYRFKNIYEAKGGGKLPITVGDALLTYIEIFGYDDVKDKLPAQMKEDVTKIWPEFLILKEDKPLERVLQPVAPPPKKLISKILPTAPKRLKIAFVNDKTPETSSWTYAHELGRQHLTDVFGDKVETVVYNDALDIEKPEDILEQAVAEGCRVIFTTTPRLVRASLKVAIEHPEIRVFNCSLNISHSYIRTYYARLHEAKVLTGIIAGALADDNRIGYIADYPIFGMAANINAFALGASMSNPRAKIYLKWSTAIGSEPVREFRKEGIHLVSGQDMITPGSSNREFGVFSLKDDGIVNVATAVTNWGQLYERLVKNILNTGISKDDHAEETKSLNYWWGLDAEVVDVIASTKLSQGTMRLIDLVKKSIARGSFRCFEGELFAQGGVMVNEEGILRPEDIVGMDWLAENVVGHIPTLSELKPEARPIVSLQGLDDAKEEK